MAASRTSSGGGARQRWIPERYARQGRFVADLGAPLLDLLDPGPGDRILDLGCGDGALTESIVERGAEVVGVDASAEQVAAARARGLDARLADGHALAFDGEFDAVVSNAALHWMTRPEAVVAGMCRALRPVGRVVAEMGGTGNVATITEALIAAMDRRGLDGEAAFPWYFPDPDGYRSVLEGGGFVVESIQLIDRPTRLPGDIAGWLETFGESFLLVVPEPERPAFVDEVREVLRPKLHHAEDDCWIADYVRLRFVAHKPEA